MKRAVSILAALLAIPACAMAQALPTMPPAGAVSDVTYYSPLHHGLYLKYFSSSKQFMNLDWWKFE
jgi:hypothetical protein